MTNVKATMYCQTNADQAPGPGQSSIALRLIAVAGKNANVFVGGQGQGVLELNNVTLDVSAQFKAGKTYEVTITEAPETA